MSVVAAPKQKSLAVAYGLWLALGLVGAHRFYLGKPKTALVFAAGTIGGLAFSFSATPEWSKLILLSVVLAIGDLARIPSLVARGTWAKTLAGDDTEVPRWRQHTADIVFLAAIAVIPSLA